jgi:hypothetical protein
VEHGKLTGEGSRGESIRRYKVCRLAQFVPVHAVLPDAFQSGVCNARRHDSAATLASMRADIKCCSSSIERSDFFLLGCWIKKSSVDEIEHIKKSKNAR